MSPAARSWESEAAAFGWPVFPIRISRNDDGSFSKRPLTQHGHKDATSRVAMFGSLWQHANGFGIPMGEVATGVGIYAFDLDFTRAKDPSAVWQWLVDHQAPIATRSHRTPSGGLHLIYLLPKGHLRLPSRANIVHGLDSRGQGGWIAFGAGYQSLGQEWLDMLPKATCEAVQAGYSGGQSIAGGDVRLADYAPPEGQEGAVLHAQLRAMLPRTPSLARRWHALKSGGDLSRSAYDQSVAYILAMKSGLTEAEIAHVLLTEYQHGACSDPGIPEHVRIRAALRSAAKARAYTSALSKAAAEEILNPPDRVDDVNVDKALDFILREQERNRK